MTSTGTRIVVTGGEGQLAACLKAYFPFAEYPGKRALDVSDPLACERYFSHRSVDLVIHTAAEIAYDAPLDAYWRHNVAGTVNIARVAASHGARLVYLSTDYVYPGTTGHYREDGPVQPIGSYAQSKYAGECAALMYPDTLAIRTSFYSRLEWSCAALDAYTSRMPILDAAAYVAALSTSTVTGIVNVGGPRRSLYEIVSSEFRPRTEPVSRRHMSLPYTLPEDVSLDCSKLHAVLGV